MINDLSILAARAAALRVKQADVGSLAISGARKLPLAGIGEWLRGQRFVNASTLNRSSKVINALAEENKVLGRQDLLRRLTGGLSEVPGVHLKDRAVGGALGGFAGYKADNLFPEDKAEGSPAVKHDLRRYLMTIAGALGGAKGLNATTNVARRYVSNTSPLSGYTRSSMVPFSLKNLWTHGVKDVPHISPGDGIAGEPPRYELFRRYLGLHRDSPEDFFVRNKDRSLSLNPNGPMKPGSPLHTKYIKHPAENPWKTGNPLTARAMYTPNENGIYPASATRLESPPGYSNSVYDNPFAGLLGSHDTRHVPGTAQRLPGGGATTQHDIGDVWNFALDPQDIDNAKSFTSGLLKTSPSRWGEYLHQPLTGSSHTVGGYLKSLGQRLGMEHGLRQNTPVFRQRAKLVYPGGTSPGQDLLPDSVEFLPGGTDRLGNMVGHALKHASALQHKYAEDVLNPEATPRKRSPLAYRPWLTPALLGTAGVGVGLAGSKILNYLRNRSSAAPGLAVPQLPATPPPAVAEPPVPETARSSIRKSLFQRLGDMAGGLASRFHHTFASGG